MLGLEHADHRHGHRHQRGLGILGEREVGLGAFPHERGELLAQGLVDLLEHGAGGGEALGQALPMPTAWLPWPGNMKAVVILLSPV